jgi:ZIP family zinc transporter
MIYVSMVELFADAKLTLITELGIRTGYLTTVVSFFGGMILIAVIDRLIPSEENPHELRNIEDMSEKKPDDTKLMRIGLMTALAVGIHNFPEGMATFMSALQAPSVAIPIAIAIAIHNIPEGIAISVPIFFATGDRKKAFKYSFLSGLSEPIGALIFYLLLMPFMSPVLMGVIFAGVAGIMVFISLDELLPSAEKYGEHHLSIYGMLGGMAVMAVSLLLFV